MRLVVRVLQESDDSPLGGEITIRFGAAGALVPGTWEGEPDILEGQREDLAFSETRSSAQGTFEVPGDGIYAVRVERGDAPELYMQVALDLREERGAFAHGNPRCMALERRRTERTRDGHRSPVTYTLTVRWGEVQEAVMGAGCRYGEAFTSRAGGRLARMVADPDVSASCIATVFAFETVVRTAEGHDDAPNWTMSVVRMVAGNRGFVVMTRRNVTSPASDEDPDISVLAIYRYIQRAGDLRPGTVLELGFLSHANWMTPALVNTYRRMPHMPYSSRAGEDCHLHCPIDREHSDLDMLLAPQLGGGDLALLGRAAYGYEPVVGDTVEVSEGVLGQRRMPSLTTRPGPTHRRTRRDRDGRNTDFCPGVLQGEGLALDRMRAAFHPSAILRVWGCNVGYDAPAFRQQRDELTDARPANERLSIATYWHNHGDGIQQEWQVRRRDFYLYFLSRVRRCYAIALAQALGRPCYAPPPGSWGAFESSSAGAMRAEHGAMMATYAGPLLYPDGVPDDMSGFDRRQLAGRASAPRELVDGGGFVRYPPDSGRVPLRIGVHVTGFEPFHGRPSNASQEVVRALQRLGVAAIERVIGYPPWIAPTLEVTFDADVEVLWTRDGSPARGDVGARRILRGARDADADLLVMVGETAALTASRSMRLERFARNRHGAGVDNGGFGGTAGLLDPSDPRQALESTVPLKAWMQAIANLSRSTQPMAPLDNPTTDPEGIVGSTGEFICNESFHTALREALETSGRWVQFVHVDEAGDAELLATSLARVIATYVEEMTWATDAWGRSAAPAERSRAA
jgi:pyrrolidone-carboxylate peptidase